MATGLRAAPARRPQGRGSGRPWSALDIQSLTYSYNKYPQLVPLIDSLADQGRVDEGEELLAEHGMDGDPSLFSILPLLSRGRLRGAGRVRMGARKPISKIGCGGREEPRNVPVGGRCPDRAGAGAAGHRRRGGRPRAGRGNPSPTPTAAQSRRDIGGAWRVRGLFEGGKWGLQDLLRQAGEHARGRRPHCCGVLRPTWTWVPRCVGEGQAVV